MKVFFYILVTMSVVACQSNSNPKESIEQSLSKDLIGTWGLSSYLDSIEATKEVAKFRVHSPSWFGILLEINEDSIKSFGSIIGIETNVINNKDTLAVLDSWIGKWMLLKGQGDLILKQFPNQEDADTTIYIYKQRKDLNVMIEDMGKGISFGSCITNYLNKSIMSGTYLNSKTNAKVEFLENGELYGLDTYDAYKVRNYFGTLHPHKNLDVVSFRSKTEDIMEQYNWQFGKDELVLTKFENEIIERNGEDVKSDYFVLGSEIITLTKVNK